MCSIQTQHACSRDIQGAQYCDTNVHRKVREHDFMVDEWQLRMHGFTNWVDSDKPAFMQC